MNQRSAVLLAVITSLMLTSGCVSHYQFPVGAKFNVSELATQKGESKIVIYRDDALYMSEFSWVVSGGNGDLAEISPGTYYVLTVPPSQVTLMADLRRNPKYAIPVDASDLAFDAIHYTNAEKENATMYRHLLARLQANDGEVTFYKWQIAPGDFGAATPIPSLVKVDKAVAKNALRGKKMAKL